MSFVETIEEAPTRLKAVSFLLFVSGLFSIVLAVIAIVTRNTVYGKLAPSLFIGGVIDIALAFGLIRREIFAYYATIVIEAFWLVYALMHHIWLSAIVSAILIAALVTSRDYYFKSSPTPAAAPATVVGRRGRYFRRL